MSNTLATVGSDLRLIIDRFLDLCPLDELQISREDLERGVNELMAGLLRVASDALAARVSGVRFADAVLDGTNFHYLRLVHLALNDILQKDVPAELVGWLERIAGKASAPIAAALEDAIAQRANDPSLTPIERATMEFLLFECVRINLVAATWLQEDQSDVVGIQLSEIDRVAEQCVHHLLSNASAAEMHENPLRTLIMLGLERLEEHREDLRRALNEATTEYQAAKAYRYVQEETLELLIRRMELGNAILIRNYLAPALGEQKLPLEILQAEHPVALESLSLDTMYQRVSRLKRKVKKTGRLPVRKKPALIDVIRELANDTENDK